MMAVKTLVFHPDKVLTTKAIPVNPHFGPLNIEPDINWVEELIKDMTDTMKEHDGVGLAAPQIGISARVIIYMDIGGSIKHVINPEIIASNGYIKSYKEGCLSCPGKRVDIRRRKQVVIKGYTFENNELEETIIKTKHKFVAFQLQHEIDHINGITILERQYM